MRTALSAPEHLRRLNTGDPLPEVQSLADCPLVDPIRLDGNCYKITAKKYITGDVKTAAFRLYPDDKEFSKGGYKRKNRSHEDMDEITLKKSLQRSKSTAADLVLQKQLDQLLTLTTRGCYDFEELKPVLSLFIRKMRKRYKDFNYVAVAELQKRGAVHYHFATKGYFHYATVRRIWNYCLAYYRLGDGNVDFTSPRSKGFKTWQGKKLAKYLAKYITKDLLTAFNKKRYWSGGTTPPVEKFLGFMAVGMSMPRMLDEVVRYLTRKPIRHYFEFHDRYGVCVATT